MKLRVQEIVALLQERLAGEAAPFDEVTLCGDVGADEQVTAVCRDTRDVVRGSLFVCLQGARHDGHDFAAEAVRLGATALLVSRRLEAVCVPQMLVSDTLRALGALAAAWRDRFAGRVVLITGSAGKTTCKDVLADVLAAPEGSDGTGGAGMRVARTPGNFNNQVGLPLSILATSGDEDVWVLEAGISEPQDMDELGAIVRPNVAVLLNVGAAHTQGLGEKGVAWHKAQLVKYVDLGGAALVNADYADLVDAVMQTELSGQMLRVVDISSAQTSMHFFSAQPAGMKDAIEGTARDATQKILYSAHFCHSAKDGDGGVYKLVHTESQETYTIHAPFVGDYGAEHVAAVASVAHVLELSMEEVVHGFALARLPRQRFEEHQRGAWRIIDDSYNANPLSMRRMIEAVVATSSTTSPHTAPCYVVLGAMGELGAEAESAHEELGRLLAHVGGQGIAHVFWKGAYAAQVRGAFVAAGGAGGEFGTRFTAVDSVEHFAAAWTAAALPAGTVLCKGSRSQRLEECVTWLLDNVAGKCQEDMDVL